MKSLIVGLGIGNLYKTVLSDLGYQVVTVDKDASKNPDYTSVETALEVHKHFDTVHVCTPNFTHREITELVAPYANIVFVEKPGFANAEEWQSTVEQFPHTRIMMVKNNMWRDNIDEFVSAANRAHIVNINWIRKNCVPNPGSWFTNKELAYGGVSRDLMPHLLSLYIAMNSNWRNSKPTEQVASQFHTLEEIDTTEYGEINTEGTYNVDDYCELAYGNKWNITADWRNLTSEASDVILYTRRGSSVYTERLDLGWCPESAYTNMIKDATTNQQNDGFWRTQLEQDVWIHQQIQAL